MEVSKNDLSRLEKAAANAVQCTGKGSVDAVVQIVQTHIKKAVTAATGAAFLPLGSRLVTGVFLSKHTNSMYNALCEELDVHFEERQKQEITKTFASFIGANIAATVTGYNGTVIFAPNPLTKTAVIITSASIAVLECGLRFLDLVVKSHQEQMSDEDLIKYAAVIAQEPVDCSCVGSNA